MAQFICANPKYLRRGLTVAVYSVESLPRGGEDAPVRAVYAIRNRATGNLYIGSSRHLLRRLRQHIWQLRRGDHHSLRLQNAWKNRGEAAFEFIVLETLLAEDGLIAREQHFVDRFAPAYNFNLEIVDNPMTGRRHSPESIEKMRQNRRGKGTAPRGKYTAEHRAAISAATKGRPGQRVGVARSAEDREKISRAVKTAFTNGRHAPSTRKVEIAGRVFESGKAAAEALGVCQQTLISKIKNGYGRYLDEDRPPHPLKPWVGRIVRSGDEHPNSRPVMVDGETFVSLTAAARHFGRNVSTMMYWLQRGRAKYKDGSPPPPPRIKRISIA